VPALPRQRHDRRASLQDLPRLGPRADDEELQRQDPARDQGSRAIRVAGKGEAGRNGGPAGDLFVVVHVEPSPLYTRRGDDLIVDVPVAYADAALGASVDVSTPEGPISLKVPAGSQPGSCSRSRGRGAPSRRRGKGDLLAAVKLTVPEKVSKQERELLEQLRKVSR
jgi:molecular chaperone DnaJ